MRQNVQKLTEELKKVAGYANGTDLVRRPDDWGALNFVEVEDDVKSALKIANDLLSLPIEQLPDNVAVEATRAAANLVPQLDALAKFSIIKGGDPNQRKAALVANLHQAADNFNRTIGLWIPALAYHRGDTEENIKKLNAVIAETSKKSEEYLKVLGEQNETANRLIESMKSAAAQSGVSVFTQDFQDEADKNDDTAKIWLGVTIGLSVLTLGALLVFYFVKIEERDLLHMLPMLACRMIAITVLFTATVWCGRMYKAMRNQAIQNRHRWLGLKTFRAFVEATQDNQTKDAVLRETTHTIFTATPTGLISESGQGDIDPSIVQIAGGMLGAQGQ